jgi:hypothetical protein
MQEGWKKLSFSFLWTKTELVSCTCVFTLEKGTQDSSSFLDYQEGRKMDILSGCYRVPRLLAAAAAYAQ